jgi:hypothetical protein
MYACVLTTSLLVCASFLSCFHRYVSLFVPEALFPFIPSFFISFSLYFSFVFSLYLFYSLFNDFLPTPSPSFYSPSLLSFSEFYSFIPFIFLLLHSIFMLSFLFLIRIYFLTFFFLFTSPLPFFSFVIFYLPLHFSHSPPNFVLLVCIQQLQ